MVSKKVPIFVGVTGASGSIYAIALLAALQHLGYPAHITASRDGIRVMQYECGFNLDDLGRYGKVYDNQDLFAGPSSGTFLMDAMVIVPCSASTMAKISIGIADTLITRAAGVMLKEKKPLIVVPREAPYSLPILESMQRLLLAGAAVLPASPGFYHHPRSFSELISHVVFKILDQLHIPHSIHGRWEDGGLDLPLV